MEDLTGKVIDGMDLNVSIVKLKWEGQEMPYNEGERVILYNREWCILKAVYAHFVETGERTVQLYLC